MKVSKKELTDKIEQIIANGVMEMEEVDITTEKVTELVWNLIQYCQDKTKKQ